MARRKRSKTIVVQVTEGAAFRCPILKGRHCTDTEKCLNRRKNKLWIKCRKCPVLLPGEEPEIQPTKRRRTKKERLEGIRPE